MSQNDWQVFLASTSDYVVTEDNLAAIELNLGQVLFKIVLPISMSWEIRRTEKAWYVFLNVQSVYENFKMLLFHLMNCVS